MKILMLGRFGLLSVGGGDRIQIESTAAELRRLGVEVDIKCDMHFDPSAYDLIHVFQLDWKPETYFYVKKALEAKVPVVLSPIHHNVKEVTRFDNEYVFDFRRVAKYLFKDQFLRDTFKNVYSSLLAPSKAYPTLYSVFTGFKNMQRATLKKVEVVLVQTSLEARDLRETFGVDFRWVKVPNGVSKRFIGAINADNLPEQLEHDENFIVCIGRIEPRKNQLSVIEAVKELREETGLDLKLVLVGFMPSTKHFEYTLRIKSALKKYPWVKYTGEVPYTSIPAIYKKAKVCVSASWFETSGLTSLEALFCGANAVASGERAEEYLGKMASYCDAGSIKSIKDAIKKEYFAERPVLSASFLRDYTWENAAKITLEVYNSVLNL